MVPPRTSPILAFACCLAVLGLAPAASAKTTGYDGTVRNILPPGQEGGIPATKHSTDQLGLYNALTPLLGKVKARDIRRYFKPAQLGTAGLKVTVEKTPRKGLRIVRDSYGVPHITGATRDDVEWGAGWVTAKDRGIFIEVVRNPARLTALDAPGVGDPIALATSGQTFTASAATERFLSEERKVFNSFGRKGKRIIKDVEAYVAGINAYYKTITTSAKPWTVNDVIATASLIGAVFGKGGGNEVRSAQFLSALQTKLGEAQGLATWRDLKSVHDPEAPTTLTKRFPYDPAPTAATPGAGIVDAGSLSAAAVSAAAASASVAKAQMSNALLVSRQRSAGGHPIAVMGPQVGYFYPQFLMELDLHGGGIDARGAAFPGVSLYVLLGRGKDFAWSATSAGSDNIDQYLEELCNTDGTPATRASNHYLYKGKCIAMTTFDAGTLKGGGKPDQRVIFNQTVHGPVSGTATVKGKPYAIASRRSTRGRDAVSARAFADLNTNKVRSATDFAKVMNQVEFTFNWHYIDNRDIAFFSSGRLPIRAPGVDPSLPTLGTGAYEWRGWLPRRKHAQAINPSSGQLLNWNNKPAPGLAAADDEWSYGPVHRAQLLAGLKKRNSIQGVVSAMNNAATQDLRAIEDWPLIRAVLSGGAAPDGRSEQAAKLVDAWLADGAHRIDADNDGKIDAPGAAVLDAAWAKLADAVLSPVLGPLVSDLATLQGRHNAPSKSGSAFGSGWYGYVSKDLRSLLGRPVIGAYSRRYCGGGDISACRVALWAAMQSAADELAGTQGTDPTKWGADSNAERIVFQPGLLGAKNTMRWTNRPTFQQVVQFVGHRPR